MKGIIAYAKGYDGVESIAGSWTGEEEFREIEKVLEARGSRQHVFEPVGVEASVPTPKDEEVMSVVSSDEPSPFVTPPGTQNPEPPSSAAPLLPSNGRIGGVPSLISGHDAETPTPGGGVLMPVI